LFHNPVDNFAVHLQQVHKVKGFGIGHMFVWRPCAHELSRKASFHSCIIYFCTLENYKYTVHLNHCLFFWIPCLFFRFLPFNNCNSTMRFLYTIQRLFIYSPFYFCFLDLGFRYVKECGFCVKKVLYSWTSSFLLNAS
jgi:hypothetical protein